MAIDGGRRLPSFLMGDKALVTFGQKPPDSSTKPSAKKLPNLDELDLTAMHSEERLRKLKAKE